MKREDKVKFAEDFIDKYLEQGFGVMSKSELDLLIFDQLKENGAWSDSASDFNIAQYLGISASRVRNLKDKLSRRTPLDEDTAKGKLRGIIKLQERWHEKSDEAKRGKVKIQIEDSYLRELAEDLVKNHGGIVDTSFNRSIIVMSGEIFFKLVYELLEKEEQDAVLKELGKPNKPSKKEKEHTPINTFIESFAKSAGEETGKKLVQLGFAAISGGASVVIDAINGIGS